MVEFGRLSTGVLEAVETLGRRAAESEGALNNAVAFACGLDPGEMAGRPMVWRCAYLGRSDDAGGDAASSFARARPTTTSRVSTPT